MTSVTHLPRDGEQAPAVVRRSLRVKSSSTAWLTLHLNAVAPAAGAARAVLLLHGATLSGFVFDPPAPALSLQARLAARGWASYALDARGFGGSTRPGAGDAGFDAQRPFGHATEGVDDVADVVRFLHDDLGHDEVALISFSWGTILAGCFAAAYPEALSRLVFSAPIYAGRNPAWIQRLADPRNPVAFSSSFGAYRWTTAQALHARWDDDILVADKQAWRSPEMLDAVIAGALASDPLSASRTPPAFRAPNGPFEDLFHACGGRRLYDAAAIRVPTLLVRGDADTTSTDADARSLVEELGARVKRYRIVDHGSHWICFERSAPQLFAACEGFLESAD
jgi:pimeloyl-ACP methyl ester carboxylesterase